MPDWIITILKSAPELASVIVVVWFSLKMSESHRKSSGSIMEGWKTFFTERDNSWREFIAAQNAGWKEFMSSENMKWIQFIDRQSELIRADRENYVSAISRLAEEVKENSRRIAENNALILSRNNEASKRTRQ